jgi:hypothetical protein
MSAMMLFVSDDFKIAKNPTVTLQLILDVLTQPPDYDQLTRVSKIPSAG